MKVSTSDLMAVTMTCEAVTQALLAAGYMYNDIKSVQQDDNLCLVWDDVNSSFLIAPIALKWTNREVPVVKGEQAEKSLFQVSQRGYIMGEFGQADMEYESLLLALDDDTALDLGENPDKFVTHENLKYCDVFTTGLMMKYLGQAYTAQGVNMEQKQVLLQAEGGSYVEYSFVLKDNNDFEIVGLPIRTWK